MTIFCYHNGLKTCWPFNITFQKQVGIMGTIHFWGLTIDIVTTMFLVLAVGLSVDYSSHIGHTFMITSGTRKGKLRKTDPKGKGKDITFKCGKARLSTALDK